MGIGQHEGLCNFYARLDWRVCFFCRFFAQHLAQLEPDLAQVGPVQPGRAHADGVYPQHPVLLGNMPKQVLAAGGVFAEVIGEDEELHFR